MSADETAGEAELRVLVADGQPYQRQLIADTVRATGRARVEYADGLAHALSSMEVFRPDVLVVDWDFSAREGLTLVRRVRSGDAGARAKAVAVIMLGQCTATEVDRARAAGIDEFISRPFSTHTMMKRVLEVRLRRRAFIETENYTGPCRRRRNADEAYDGPRRRLLDAQDPRADAPEVSIRKGIARMYVDRISVQLKALSPDDSGAFRELCLVCGQLNTLAADMKDRILASATNSLFSYLNAVALGAPLNAEVVTAHLAAIVQLAELQNHQVDLRRTVAHELGVMVQKKLSQAGRAA